MYVQKRPPAPRAGSLASLVASWQKPCRGPCPKVNLKLREAGSTVARIRQQLFLALSSFSLAHFFCVARPNNIQRPMSTPSAIEASLHGASLAGPPALDNTVDGAAIVSIAHGERGVTKLRDLLAGDVLGASDRALALSLISAQVRGAIHGESERARDFALRGGVVDVSLSLLVRDDDELVRARAAALIGDLLRGSGTGDSTVFISGDGLAAVAVSACSDAAASVRSASAEALVAAFGGDLAAVSAFAVEPGAVSALADAVRVAGSGAVRAAALFVSRGGDAAIAASLIEGAPLLVAVIDWLAATGNALGIADTFAKGPEVDPSSLDLDAAPADAALDALIALRSLCVTSEGKEAAFAANAHSAIMPFLSSSYAVVITAAAGTLSSLCIHLPALRALLDSFGQEGGALVCGALLPILKSLQHPSLNFAARGLIRAVASLPGGRAAAFAAAIALRAVRELVCVLPIADAARDLVDIAKMDVEGPQSHAALEGLDELCKRPGGREEVLELPVGERVLDMLSTLNES